MLTNTTREAAAAADEDDALVAEAGAGDGDAMEHGSLLQVEREQLLLTND